MLLLSPREGYVRAAWPDILRERILVMRSGGMGREDAPTLVETVERVDASRPDERVDVSTLGPRRTTGATVLEVRDEAGGALYLRGSALGRYDGAAWGGAATDPPAAAEGVWQEQAARLAALGPARALSVRHLAGATEIAYAPYYPVSGEAEAGEAYASVRRAADALWLDVCAAGRAGPGRGGQRGGAGLPAVGAGGVYGRAGGARRRAAAHRGAGGASTRPRRAKRSRSRWPRTSARPRITTSRRSAPRRGRISSCIS